MNRKSDDFSDTLSTPTTESTVRTTGRVKKPKTVFDPSDNYVPRAQRTASQLAATATSSFTLLTSDPNVTINSNVQQQNNKSPSASVTSMEAGQYDDGNNYDTCVKCFKTNRRRAQGLKTKFLTCKSCTKKWHLSCQNIQFENLILARKRYKCESCRVCSVCFGKKMDKVDSPKRVDLIMCSACVKTYHLDCHSPILQKTSIIKRTFKCAECIDSIDSKANAIIDSPPKTEIQNIKISQMSEQQSEIVEIQSNHENIQPEPIDVKSVRLWTVEDVVKFFEKYYPEEAPIFKNHDIDGTSLILLKRQDVIKRFKLKLGPSLRIYELILALQTQNDAVENAWCD